LKKNIESTNTKMDFITFTESGWWYRKVLHPIAQLAKEEILTVGIVTLPFLFEGKVRQEQAK
jgi:cell division protein FtsZ